MIYDAISRTAGHPILHAPFPNIRKGLFRTGMGSIGSVFLLFKTKISNFAEKKRDGVDFRYIEVSLCRGRTFLHMASDNESHIGGDKP